MTVRIKRVYDPPDSTDGRRFLVDRVWPRGKKKEQLALDGWIKDASPSTALRKAYHGDAQRWEEFVRHYRAELEADPQAWQLLLDAAREGDITLLYASRDPQYNNAEALRAFLEEKLRSD